MPTYQVASQRPWRLTISLSEKRTGGRSLITERREREYPTKRIAGRVPATATNAARACVAGRAQQAPRQI